MTNHLLNENSPYLLQHANNPVDWYPWGPEALERSRLEAKPIFLSIGYAACHWCHVMAHESFEDPETATLMNKHFINIKVDREERPDLDYIYMNAVMATTGQGGWPMSVFLTPDGQPFFGGTYFPPVRRHNLPAFREVLTRIVQVWNEDREQILVSAAKITDYLKNTNTISENRQVLENKDIDQAVYNLAQAYDWKNGGWGSAPKFPQPMTVEFLLRRAMRGDKLARDMAIHTLDAMARGGMYDVVGGGFSRYSTDNSWKVPHFEKMLYDNAQLSLVYLHAYLITGNSAYRNIVEKTLGFVQRELTDPAGGFYSSLDADSEGEEGKYYIWSSEELKTIFQDQNAFAIYQTAYGITETGNFEGKNVLQRVLTDQELTERFNLPEREVAPLLERLNELLMQARLSRVPPSADNKVIGMWNALALIAFSEAARYLDDGYLQLAIHNGRFLKHHLYQDGVLLRSWRKGKAQHAAYLEDYAGMILGFLSLYQSDPDPEWFEWAYQLADEMIQHFLNPGGGFFDTRDNQDSLILRPQDYQDNTTPSGNSLAATALLQMSIYSGRMEWKDMAEQALVKMGASAIRYPTAFSYWLSVEDFNINPAQEVAILGDPTSPATQSLVKVLWSRYRPNLVAARGSLPIPTASPMLLQERMMVNNLPTAYVCENMSCQLPVNDPEDLRRQLEPESGLWTHDN
jgi:uncharacterized protein